MRKTQFARVHNRHITFSWHPQKKKKTLARWHISPLIIREFNTSNTLVARVQATWYLRTVAIVIIYPEDVCRQTRTGWIWRVLSWKEKVITTAGYLRGQMTILLVKFMVLRRSYLASGCILPKWSEVRFKGANQSSRTSSLLDEWGSALTCPGCPAAL